MSQKLSEFLSSFGLMMLGTVLVFSGTLFFAKMPSPQKKFRFPVAGPRSLAAGGDIEPVVLPSSRPSVPLAIDKADFNKPLTATNVLVVDDETNTFLFKKNSEATKPLASITKLMSALVLLDLPINWATTTVVLEDDVDSSSHHINIGEEFTLDDLWHVALIGSSNAAISALVRASGITLERFITLMNKKAYDLNLPSLKFVEPTGLHSGNVGNVFDTSKLLREALRFSKIINALQIGEYYTHPLNKNKPRRVWTTDWLLTNWIPNNFNKDGVAGKTGYIDASGYNFAVKLTDTKGHAVRVIIIGAASNEARFIEARDLAAWAFSNYLWPDEMGYDKLAE